jgi:hypothetical protein
MLKSKLVSELNFISAEYDRLVREYGAGIGGTPDEIFNLLELLKHANESLKHFVDAKYNLDQVKEVIQNDLSKL